MSACSCHPLLNLPLWSSLACSLSALFFAPLAHGEESTVTLALCRANPACTVQQPDPTGSTLFIISRARETLFVRCAADGTCRRMYPKGKSAPIINLQLVFAAK